MWTSPAATRRRAASSLERFTRRRLPKAPKTRRHMPFAPGCFGKQSTAPAFEAPCRSAAKKASLALATHQRQRRDSYYDFARAMAM